MRLYTHEKRKATEREKKRYPVSSSAIVIKQQIIRCRGRNEDRDKASCRARTSGRHFVAARRRVANVRSVVRATGARLFSTKSHIVKSVRIIAKLSVPLHTRLVKLYKI